VRESTTTTSASVLYIVGATRSGSTLLERMLGAITGWVNVGELVSIFTRGVVLNEPCGCGDRFDACPFWREVGQRAFGGWDQKHARLTLEFRRAAVRERYLPRLLLGSAERTPHWREARQYVQTFETLHCAISEVTGATVIVDSSKDAIHGLYMSRCSATDFRPLQLVRDPRGVAFSWSKRNIYRPNSVAGNTPMNVYPPRHAASMWNHANFWAAVLRTQARSTTVRYEELVERPLPCIARALNSLALEAADLEHVAKTDVALATSHSISGNPALYAADRIDLRLDDVWRTELPVLQRCAVSAYTAPVRLMLAIDQSRRRDPRPSNSG
jgi:hypothetical protein